MEIENFISKIKGNVREVEDAPESPEELDIQDDILPPDPKPARKASPKAAPPRVNAQVRKQLKDSLYMMIAIPAGIVAVRDPICGGAVLEHVDNVIDRLIPIVCRNPAMLRWFTEGAGYMDWLGLAAAVAPIAQVVWSHHVTGSLHEEDEEDAADDYSRYAAPAFSG
jgi:hypothetical protein